MFKSGDEVLCLTADMQGLLRKNNIYVVASEWIRGGDGERFVILQGATGNMSFFKHRFKLIEEEEN